jgi:hypothetical protein
MLTLLLIGTALIVISVIIEASFIEIAQHAWHRCFGTTEKLWLGFAPFIAMLTAITLWMIAALAIVVGLWSYVFLRLDAFQTFEECLYFALVAFTTLGFGDVILPTNLSLLSGFIAANGFVIFGMNTAFLMDVMMRLRAR